MTPSESLRLTARAFRLDDDCWARHANPWSVWTRLPILPAITLLLLARESLGWWVFPGLCVAVLWAFVNPRAFPPPPDARAWASRAVLGERLWLAPETKVPVAVAAAVRKMVAVQILGMLPLILGLWRLDTGLALLGLVLVLGGKMLFLQVMVRFWDRHGDGALPGQPSPPPRQSNSPPGDGAAMG
ncbi:MAG: DUF6653 family protein [Pseudomonadota bacterium]